MDPERWGRIEALYEAALAVEPDRRAAFLAENCHGDESLRSEVESLVLHGEDPGSFLEPPLMGLELRAGQTVSHYKIEGQIGQGGMAIVYRAYDSQLRRRVALKVLRPEYVASAAHRERLLREARAASTLSHPNILNIYEIGSAGGVHFIAMELIEGSVLTQLIPSPGMPVKKALDYAIQIAAALARAHAAGVVHRDLKPSNIMVTIDGTVKLLDFGLARQLHLGPEQETRLTVEGAIAGTPAYMSPEQAKGQTLDSRSDVFSFGVVLYQMLSGRHAFTGDSAASILAAVLREDPQPLGPDVPAALAGIVDRCLRKDLARRSQSIADVRIALDELNEQLLPGKRSPGIHGTSRTRHWVSEIAFLAITVAGLAWVFARVRPAVPAAAMRLSVLLAASGLTLTDAGLAISPDGQTLVFGATDGAGVRLFVRPVRDWTISPLPGTENASNPFFSPDGKWLAFAAAYGHGLQRIPLDGGAPQPICALDDLSGAAWATDGRIVAAWVRQGKTGLWSVPEEGGSPTLLKEPPIAPETVWYMWPDWLPGAGGVLFTERRPRHASIAALSLRTGEVRTLIQSGWHSRYLPSGHLIYESEGSLYAVPFDPERLALRGVPRLVINDIGTSIFANDNYAVSHTGTIVYAPASTRLGQLAWTDRRGNTMPLRLPPAVYAAPALSPDGLRLAVTIYSGPVRNIWTGSLNDETLTQLTFSNDDVFSVFTPDGRYVAYTSEQNNRYNLFRIASDGSGAPERLMDSADWKKTTSWHGSTLLFNSGTAAGDYDIWRFDMNNRQARPFVKTLGDELEAAISPDGHWVAYQSLQSGNWDIYVQAFPGPGPKNRVSTRGGTGARWNPRGGGVFYQAEGAIWEVPVENGHTKGSPVRLFALAPYGRSLGTIARNWDVAPDGEHFLVIQNARPDSRLNLITNWFEELKARVPVSGR